MILSDNKFTAMLATHYVIILSVSSGNVIVIPHNNNRKLENLSFFNCPLVEKFNFLKVSFDGSACIKTIFLSSIQAQLDVEAEAMRASQRELLSVEDTVYMPDKDTEPVNRTLIQKAGYLNIRK